MSDVVVKTGWDNSGIIGGSREAVGIVRRASQQAQEIMSRFGGVAKVALGFGGLALSGAAIKRTLQRYDDLADASARLNETAETIQRVEAASMRLASVDVNGLTKSFLFLEKALAEKSDKGVQALNRLGVTAEGLAGMTLDQKVFALRDAFEEARNKGAGYTEMLALMGKSAGELIPLFQASREEIQGWMDGANVLSDAAVMKLAELNDKADQFTGNMQTGLAALLAMVAGAGEMAGSLVSKAVGGQDATWDEMIYSLVDRVVDLYPWDKLVGTGIDDALYDAFGSAAADARALEVERKRAAAATAQAEQAAIAETEAAREAAAKKEKEDMQARMKLLHEMRTLALQIEAAKLDLMPDAQKLEALAGRLAEVFSESGMNAGVDIGSVAELEALLQRQQAAGDVAGAAQTLKSLKAALDIEKELAAIQAKMRNEGAARAEAEAALQARREELELEIQIQEAIQRTADEENKEVQALQRQLAVQREQERLMQSLNLSSSEALSLAERRVDAELAAAEAIRAAEKARGQAESKRGLLEEFRILEAKASGQSELAAKLEKEAAIRQRAKQIMEETGASQERAMQIARRIQELQERAEERARGGSSSHGSDDGRRKIRSITGERRDEIMAAFRDGGLNAFYRAQARTLDGSRVIPVGKLFDAEQRRAREGGDSAIQSDIKDVLLRVESQLERINVG